jgi:hypothetical protein
MPAVHHALPAVTNATGHIKATQAQPFNDIQIAAGPQM